MPRTPLSLPPTRSLTLLTAYPWLISGGLVLAATLGVPVPQARGDIWDWIYAVVLMISLLGAVLISAMGNVKLSAWMVNAFPSTGKRGFRIFVYSLFVVAGLSVIVWSQIWTRELIAKIERGGAETDYVVLDAFKVFMVGWAILLAYKLKLFWDYLVKLMAPDEAS